MIDNRQIVRIWKALGDERRIEILDLLKIGERCACELLERLDIGQSTLSHHMKILCDSGIVNYRKQGKWMYYSINYDLAKELSLFFEELSKPKAIIQFCDCQTGFKKK